MNLLTKDMMLELLSVNEGTCISLYMPTHRAHPNNLRDPILFKNLLRNLKESLLKKHSESEVEILLDPFVALESNKEFWRHTLDGLAVLGTVDTFRTISLPVPVKELTVVANSFHTKPLRRYLQSVERYNVLGLSLHDFQIYEGNRHSLTELELPSDTPKNINEALGYDLTDKHTTVASYGGIGNQTSNMHHGQGGKSDEADIDTEKFFRFVAKTINDNYSGPSGLPLILAALPEHHNLFHKVSNNLSLLPSGIDVNPKSVETDELVKHAWKVMEPYYNENIAKICNEYDQAKSKDTASDNISEVAVAAAAGKVDTLLIESEIQIPGKIINETGSIEKGDLANPEVDDLLDDLGELVTKMGGKVMIIPHEKMPTKTGVAGLFRY
ncbi:baeRF3 domain-containing protein [Flavobacterium frigoris]|uniref:Stalled ribosome rescue protein Dom34, pelota family n=1 Tax=Flavobacterium frigoris TaxID=229204 RepID=A0A1H9MYW3_FLAFI|nr:hypothetical protein [Flavobacterium frigoris]SER28669.1 Stalled ribosome rescue protein Dom34, pelota family [Flavobacterium frigoris]